MNLAKGRLGALLAISAMMFMPQKGHAAGPLDVEIGLTWWVHDVEVSGAGSSSADDTGAYAEIWWAEGWGLATDYFNSDPDEGRFEDASDFSVDIKRRVLSPTENNYLALGAGWQDIDVASGASTSGPRLLIEGRGGVGILFAYGQMAWMPDLGDTGVFRDVEGTETQVGLSLTPFPFLNLRLGYRVMDLDFRGGSRKADGYLLGGAVHF